MVLDLACKSNSAQGIFSLSILLGPTWPCRFAILLRSSVLASDQGIATRRVAPLFKSKECLAIRAYQGEMVYTAPDPGQLFQMTKTGAAVQVLIQLLCVLYCFQQLLYEVFLAVPTVIGRCDRRERCDHCDRQISDSESQPA